MKLSIDKNVLSAAVLCVAGEKEPRYYLHGALIHFISADKVAVVATTGDYMFVNISKPVESEFNSELQVIIDVDTIKTAIKTSPKDSDYLILGSLPEGNYQLGNTVFKPINAYYPPYQRVIPIEIDNTLGEFNANYLAIGQKALNLANNTKNDVYHLHHNGSSAAIMQSNNSVFVIMPCRPDGAEDYIPLDFSSPQELKQAA